MTDERDAQRKAADHWMGEANDEHNENVRLREQVRVLRDALNAMLTHMGMDEDDWNKPTYDQARAALAATKEKP